MSTDVIPIPRSPMHELRNDPVAMESEVLRLRWEAGHYRRLFLEAREREKKLQATVEELQAKIKKLKHDAFGKKSEKGPNRSEASPSSPPPEKRKRGQQPGKPKPKRRDYDHLPGKDENASLDTEETKCSCCGLAFAKFPGTETSKVLEIEVRAHVRRVHRERYRPTCQCSENPGILTTPPPPKLIAKGLYGVSIWTEVLLDKFLFFQPTHRRLADWQSLGVDLPIGTITGGLKRITGLFSPIYDAIRARCQQADHWHGDETGWRVFVKHPEKQDSKRTLWVFRSPEAVVFDIALTRGAAEAERFFGSEAEGILSVDRYVSYKALDAVKQGTLVLAFCWAHARRDFLDAARSWEQLQGWALAWRDRIGTLFHINKKRVAAWKQDPRGSEFEKLDKQLRTEIEAFTTERDNQLADEKLHPQAEKVLTSLVNHWDGLTVFLEHPEVPMDNTEAERKLRGPTMGRKNYWGSGAEWSADLAECCFSLAATLMLAQLNVRTWLTAFLTACAGAGGVRPARDRGENGSFEHRVPLNVERLLPWNLTEKEKEAFREPPSGLELPKGVRALLDALREEGARTVVIESESSSDDEASESDDGVSDSDDGVSDSDDGASDSDDVASDSEVGVSGSDEGVPDSDDVASDSDEGVSDSDDPVSDSDDGASDSDDVASDSDEGMSGSDEGVSDSDEGVSGNDHAASDTLTPVDSPPSETETTSASMTAVTSPLLQSLIVLVTWLAGRLSAIPRNVRRRARRLRPTLDRTIRRCTTARTEWHYRFARQDLRQPPGVSDA